MFTCADGRKTSRRKGKPSYAQKLGFYHQKLGFVEPVIFIFWIFVTRVKLTIKLFALGKTWISKLQIPGIKESQIQEACNVLWILFPNPCTCPKHDRYFSGATGPLFFGREKNARQSQFCKVIYRGSTTPLILSYLWGPGPTVSRDFPVVGRSWTHRFLFGISGLQSYRQSSSGLGSTSWELAWICGCASGCLNYLDVPGS